MQFDRNWQKKRIDRDFNVVKCQMKTELIKCVLHLVYLEHPKIIFIYRGKKKKTFESIFTRRDNRNMRERWANTERNLSA